LLAVQRFRSILELRVATIQLKTNEISFSIQHNCLETNPPLGDNPLGDIAIPQRDGSMDPRETAAHAKKKLLND